MKQADMHINFKDDTDQALDQLIPLSITHSGHYILPLTRATKLLPKVSTQLPSAQSNITLHLSKDCQGQPKSVIADKIHRQFAHAPADKLIRLLNNAGSPWCEDKELNDQLKSTVRECKTCKLYKKPLPTPVVAMPLASWFQQTVAIDLKFYWGKIILHLIDHVTRLSAAVQIPSKHPKAIIKAIFSNWVCMVQPTNFFTIYGGEFVNEDFTQLCEAFHMSVKTTSAEAMAWWSVIIWCYLKC